MTVPQPPPYYDPHSKCIKFEGDVGDGVTLSGSIISPISNFPFLPGKLLLGEIIEIIDPATCEEKDSGAGTGRDCYDGAAGGLLTRSFIGSVLSRRDDNEDVHVLDTDSADAQSSRELLLQKQRELQSLHAHQNQKMLYKQQRDWLWFYEKNLSEGRLRELVGIHQRESMDMQCRHQAEQFEMIDLVIDCMMSIIDRPRKPPKRARTEHSSTQTVGPYPYPEKPQATEIVVHEPPAISDPPARKSYPVPLTEIAAPKKLPVLAPSASLPDRITLDRQKADEIKAVMRNRSLSREERQRRLADIKERYTVAPHAATAPAVMATAIVAVDEEMSATERRRLELQALMRDKSLSRDEKQERMAEVQARFAAESASGSGRKPKPKADQDQDKGHRAKPRAEAARRQKVKEKEEDDPAQLSTRRGKAAASAGQEKVERARARAVARRRKREHEEEEEEQVRQPTKAALALRRRPSHPLEGYKMKDVPTHSSEECSNNGSGPPSEEAGKEEEETVKPTRETAASRWNRAAVKAATSNVVARVAGCEDEEEVTVDPPRETAASRWNRAAVKVATSNMVARETSPGIQDEDSGDPPKETAASRWNRAAVKVATSNLVSREVKHHSDDGPDTEEECTPGPDTDDEEKSDEGDNDGEPSSRKKAVDRWNKAAVGVAVTHMISSPGGSGAGDANRLSGKSARSSGTDMVFDKPNGASHTTENKNVPITELCTDEADPDPLEEIPTDRTPIKKLVKRLADDDPGLTILKLDGRKKIKAGDWELLFESLEENSTMTHLSMSRCEITDEMAVALVLALVENETLVSLRLNNNKGLTDDTARGFIKVLNQSNKTLKTLEMTRTKVTKGSIRKINEILEERDDKKKAAKVQEERQKKIKALLSFSAGDKLARESKEEEGADETKDGDDRLDESHVSTVMSVGSGTSSRMASSKASSKKKRTGRRRTNDTSSKASGKKGSGKRGTSKQRGSSRPRGVAGPSAAGRRPPRSLQASVTAHHMAQLGGDLTGLGGDISKLKEQRKLRGECEICGQRCYTKTMFKNTPLTIPNLVYEGRCLKCNPM